MLKLALTVALAAAVASAVDPQISVNSDGKLVSVVDGMSFDHGDMASLRTQRATSENVVDLMKEMITGNKEMVKSTDALATTLEASMEKLAANLGNTTGGFGGGGGGGGVTILSGSGTGTKATGLPWNPIATPAVPLSDAGGEPVRIFFPTGAQLVSHPSVKQYQCQFTMLDDKGQLTKEVRKSAKVAAETARTFECISPQWNAPGDLPKLSKWKTQLTLFENDRELPSAKLKSTHNWAPATPKTNMPATFASTGPKSGKTFTVPFKLVYPYGANGYKDVQVSTKGDGASGLSNIKIGIPDTGAPERTLSFVIKTDTKVKQFKILITATSTKTSLRSVHILTINHQTLPDVLGKGGSLGMITGEAVERLVKQVVASTNGGDKGDNSKWTMCTSWKKNGYSSTSHFRANCMNKGPLIFVHKRGANGRTFGGFSSDSWRPTNGGYFYGSATDRKRSWLFRINPSNDKDVEFVHKEKRTQHGYPSNSNYFMCFGGGHDICSRQNSGPYTYSNLGHGYNPESESKAGRNCYSTSTCKNYLGGAYSWYQQREGDRYEVYIIKK